MSPPEPEIRSEGLLRNSIVTLTNHNRPNKHFEAIKLEADRSNSRQGRQLTICFGLTSDWLKKKWGKYSKAKPNQT